MKKLLTLVLAGGMMAFYACGPSKEDQEKEAKRKADSAHVADSTAQAMEAEKAKHTQDSLDQVAADMKAKAAADSARIADSIAKAGKGGKPKPKKTEAQKATQGRG